MGGVIKIKVGIVGSHGTGKTTLVNELSGFYGVEVIDEKARESAEFLSISNLDEVKDNKELMSVYQWDIIRRQLNAESNLSSFISDRTTLDNFIYYRFNNNDTPYTFNAYRDMAINNLPNYDLIIYTPIIIEIQDDGFRNLEKSYQDLIDDELRLELQRNRNMINEVYLLSSSSVEGRLEECKEVISSRLYMRKEKTKG